MIGNISSAEELVALLQRYEDIIHILREEALSEELISEAEYEKFGERSTYETLGRVESHKKIADKASQRDEFESKLTSLKDDYQTIKDKLDAIQVQFAQAKAEQKKNLNQINELKVDNRYYIELYKTASTKIESLSHSNQLNEHALVYLRNLLIDNSTENLTLAQAYLRENDEVYADFISKMQELYDDLIVFEEMDEDAYHRERNALIRTFVPKKLTSLYKRPIFLEEKTPEEILTERGGYEYPDDPDEDL